VEDTTTKSSELSDVHVESLRALSKATALLRARYPDIESFHDEMLRLMPFFKPSNVAIEAYLEGLSLIAKLSWHSQAPARCAETPWRLANQKCEPASQPGGVQ
jgi:hypothetical protein